MTEKESELLERRQGQRAERGGFPGVRSHLLLLDYSVTLTIKE